jgi:Undecaprenyl-phosphate galactose phosphotransferase WbaP
MFALTLLADLAGFGLAGIIVYLLNETLHLFMVNGSDLKYLIVVVLCLMLFMSSRLYPGIGLNPAEELRLVTHFVTLGFMVGLIFFIIVQPGWHPNYWALLPAWGISLATLLFSRWGLRILFVRFGWWGEPVVVISRKEKMGRLVRYFLERGRLGLIPVLGVTEQNNDPSSSPIKMMTTADFLALPHDYFARRGIHTALVGNLILSDLAHSNENRNLLNKFQRMIFVSDMGWLEGASVSYHDFEGMLGMETQQNLLSPLDAVVKRATDILISILLALLCLPVGLLVAVWIRLDSPGPIFYSQERVGKDGRKILIYKFRTMKVNADKLLAEYLASDLAARTEWEQNQKLFNDPRITRAGRWIRRFSLDEIPQFFNILKGDMSLVGPRPIMLEQEKMYGDQIEVYSSVRPGLTGFWQVSGRNQTSFSQRVTFDVYYVRNWSVWLDMYIFLRTIWVVLSRDGAC